MRSNWLSRSSVIIVISFVLLAALAGCGGAGSRQTPTPAPTIQSIGKMSNGEAWAELSLVGRTGAGWIVEATYTLPAAAGLDAATLTVSRADQPGLSQTLQQSTSGAITVTITAPMPAPDAGVWVEISAAGLRSSGETFPLGLARLEASDQSWQVVALNSSYNSPVIVPTVPVGPPTVPAGEATAIEPAATAEATAVPATPTTAPTVSAPLPTVVTVSPTKAVRTAVPTVAPVATRVVATVTRGPTSAVPGALMVAITSPDDGASATDSIAISGMGLAFENQVMVELLDASGNKLAQSGATIDAEVGYIGPWEVVLDFPQVATTQTGKIRAYVTSPRDGSVAAQSTVRVRLLGGGGAATVTPAPVSGTVVEITSPAAGSVVKGAVVVSGRARVFENQFTLQALDSDGHVWAEAHVIYVAEPGELGDWEATLDLSALPAARPGKIYAFATSAKDGSIAAEDSVNVQLAVE